MILSVCHNGNCSPVYLCQVINIIDSVPNARAVYFNKLTLEPFKKEFSGIIDISIGVTVIVVDDDKCNVSMLVDYVKKNKDRLIEQWYNCRVMKGGGGAT